MTRLIAIFILLAATIAHASNRCADSSLLMSNGTTTLSKSLGARCTASRSYTCDKGGMTAWGFDIVSPCAAKFVTYAIQTGDSNSAHQYDLGLYCIQGPCITSTAPAGSLYLHTGYLPGPTFAPPGSRGLIKPALTWATTTVCPTLPCTLPAGSYALAVATNCDGTPPDTPCAALYGDADRGAMYSFLVWVGGAAGTIATDGVNNHNTSLQPLRIFADFDPSGGLPTVITPPVIDPAIKTGNGTGPNPKPPIIMFFSDVD